MLKYFLLFVFHVCTCIVRVALSPLAYEKIVIASWWFFVVNNKGWKIWIKIYLYTSVRVYLG